MKPLELTAAPLARMRAPKPILQAAGLFLITGDTGWEDHIFDAIYRLFGEASGSGGPRAGARFPAIMPMRHRHLCALPVCAHWAKSRYAHAGYERGASGHRHRHPAAKADMRNLTTGQTCSGVTEVTREVVALLGMDAGQYAQLRLRRAIPQILLATSEAQNIPPRVRHGAV